MSKPRIKPLSPFLLARHEAAAGKVPLANPITVVEAFAGPLTEFGGVPLHRVTGAHLMALEEIHSPLPALVNRLAVVKSRDAQEEWVRIIAEGMTVKDCASAFAILASDAEAVFNLTQSEPDWKEQVLRNGMAGMKHLSLPQMMELKVKLVECYVAAFKTAISGSSDAGSASAENPTTGTGQKPVPQPAASAGI